MKNGKPQVKKYDPIYLGQTGQSRAERRAAERATKPKHKKK